MIIIIIALSTLIQSVLARYQIPSLNSLFFKKPTALDIKKKKKKK